MYGKSLCLLHQFTTRWLEEENTPTYLCPPCSVLALKPYLVSSECYLSRAELGEWCDEVGQHVHCHYPLLVRILADDGMTDKTLHHRNRSTHQQQ